jgi:DNA processing protein
MFGDMVTDRHERAAVLALAGAASDARIEWHRAAAVVDGAGSALEVLKGRWTGLESFETDDADQLARYVTSEKLKMYELMIAEAETRGDHVITVLDEAYPLNLRRVYNRPPFLFVRGRLDERDNHAVAVVGTRDASKRGLAQADRLSRDLAASGVTVLSGLALGIDSAAHRGALAASGRTVAVMGTGLDKIYPRANEPLAEAILGSGGALVSQFWPGAPPARWSFPMRNVVMSGMAIGTVVVEASSTSGAKMQARLALEHGKQVYLVESLVLHEEWARRYVKRGAHVVKSVEDILSTLVALAKPSRQLTLG